VLVFPQHQIQKGPSWGYSHGPRTRSLPSVFGPAWSEFLYMSRNPIQETVRLNRILLSTEHCWMENIIGLCRQQWPFIWIFAVAFSYTELIDPIICILHP
jgi:hypothetical protein